MMSVVHGDEWKVQRLRYHPSLPCILTEWLDGTSDRFLPSCISSTLLLFFSVPVSLRAVMWLNVAFHSVSSRNDNKG